jgi:hypothetical protein
MVMEGESSSLSKSSGNLASGDLYTPFSSVSSASHIQVSERG